VSPYNHEGEAPGAGGISSEEQEGATRLPHLRLPATSCEKTKEKRFVPVALTPGFTYVAAILRAPSEFRT